MCVCTYAYTCTLNTHTYTCAYIHVYGYVAEHFLGTDTALVTHEPACGIKKR